MGTGRNDGGNVRKIVLSVVGHTHNDKTQRLQTQSLVAHVSSACALTGNKL
jgi:hypothetical protein